MKNGELKIENKMPPVRRNARDDGDFSAFVATIPKLKIGQSFVIPYASSHYRLAASLAKSWLGIQVTMVREGDNWRIGRTA